MRILLPLKLLKAMLVAVPLSLITVFSSHAALITQYGTDLSFTYDDQSAYGTGFVIGNGIFFLPNNIELSSVDGNNPTPRSDLLDITITINPGSSFLLDSITTHETGDYILNGEGSSVKASLYTLVTSLTWGWPLATNEVIADTGLITSPQDGTTNGWNLTNVNEWGWANETSIIFRIQNTLTATTLETGELAFIEKKQVPIGIDVTVVPVPGAAWLMLSALAGLLMARRVQA